MFNLPRLMTVIDCGPIGYPGLEVEFWLNPTRLDYEPPAEGEPWESSYWFALGRTIERVTVPAEMTESGKRTTIEIPDARAIYDLAEAPGFDWQIIVWAFEQYGKQRQERLKVELGN